MTQPTLNDDAARVRRLGLDAHWQAALRSRAVVVLAAVLAAQLVLALLLGGGRSMAPATGEDPLLGLDAAAVTAMEIASEDGSRVELVRVGAGWVLPALDDFPASASQVERLLNDLTALQRPLPVASSADARRRFKVADDAFERRLVLRGDTGERTLFLGDSPGFRRLFARVGGEDAVYDLRLALFDIGVSPDDWIDRGTLQFDRGGISRVVVEDAEDRFALVRGEEGWSLEGTAAAVDGSAADAFANAVATVSYTSVLGPESDAEYDLEEPARVITVEHSGTERRYRLAPIADGEDAALQREGEPYVYRLSAFDAETLLETDRAGLLGEMPEAEERAGADAETNAKTNAGADAQMPEVSAGETPAATTAGQQPSADASPPPLGVAPEPEMPPATPASD